MGDFGATGGSSGLVSFSLEAARNRLRGVTTISKWGRNMDIDQINTATAVVIGRDIWDLGIAGADIWVPPTAARIHALASSNDEDGAGGATGALTIHIMGLDAAFTLQQEDLTLNGITSVNTVNAYTMIYRVIVLTVGSTGRNLGNIDATAAVDGTVTARISISMNQSHMAIFQIPAAKTGFLLSTYAAIHKVGGAGTFADTGLMLKDFGAGWRHQDAFEVGIEGTSHVQHMYSTPLILPAKSYIKMVANPSKAAQDISAGFDIIMIDD